MNRSTTLVLLLAFGVGVIVSFALAGGDDDEEPSPATTPAFSVTDDVDPGKTEITLPPSKPNPKPTPLDAAIERAVIAYVESAERGEVDSEGLPTSDELSIAVSIVAGSRATVRLTGGTRLELRRSAGNWRVVNVDPVIPEPTPPSGPP